MKESENKKPALFPTSQGIMSGEFENINIETSTYYFRYMDLGQHFRCPSLS